MTEDPPMNADAGPPPAADTRTSARLSHRRHAHAKGWKSWLVAGLCLLLVLAAGVVIGVGATVIYFERRDFRPPRPAEVGKTILDRMGDTVSLSSDERTRISDMIDARMATVESLRTESLERIRGEFDEMRNDIDEVLGPARSAKWEEEVKKRMGERKRHRRGRDGERGDSRGHH